MRKLALVVTAATLAAWFAPAGAQTTATLPVTCAPGATGTCVRATPVVNPYGSSVGATALPSGSNTIGAVVVRGAPTLSAAQISVGTTATLLAAARTGRSRVTIAVGAANSCAFSGAAGVTLSTGYALQPVAGASRAWEYSGALYGVCSATTTISVDEIY